MTLALLHTSNSKEEACLHSAVALGDTDAVNALIPQLNGTGKAVDEERLANLMAFQRIRREIFEDEPYEIEGIGKQSRMKSLYPYDFQRDTARAVTAIKNLAAGMSGEERITRPIELAMHAHRNIAYQIRTLRNALPEGEQDIDDVIHHVAASCMDFHGASEDPLTERAANAELPQSVWDKAIAHAEEAAMSLEHLLKQYVKSRGQAAGSSPSH